MLHKSKGGRQREITLKFNFSLCKKTLWLPVLRGMFSILVQCFSISCALLAALTNWIQYINMHFAKHTEG